MNTTTCSQIAAGKGDTGFLDRQARRLLHRALGRVRGVRLVLVDAHARTVLGEADLVLGPEITLAVHDPRFYREVILRGSTGAGYAYMQRWWDTDDLPGLIEALARNAALLESLRSGWSRLAAPAARAWHALRDNTRAGSRRNIAAHYDLGNDFFRLFLDPTMTYSSAWFDDPEVSLEAASIAKLDRLCRKLDLRATDHVLEIGTGWGSFAIHAASRYGCRVTTTTISQEQHALATARVKRAGLADRVTVLLEDYRDLTGTYDKVVSVEMIEAVGARHLDGYLQVIADRLAPHGAAAIQAITIRDHLYRDALRTVDFIKRHIFPGTFIPSVSAIAGATARTDLQTTDLEDLTPHYAETLRRWRRAFLSHRDEAASQGYDEPFLRGWEFYLAYCEGGFRARRIGCAQLLLTRPGWRSCADSMLGTSWRADGGEPVEAPIEVAW